LSKILIIDDETNLRTMMQLALEHSGYEVDTAEDGQVGLEKFGDGSGVDLVLLDQRMPGLSGTEVQRELRKRKQDVKVIVTTAFGTLDLAERVMDAGACDFLRKPFTADTLRLSVRTALEQKRLPDAKPTGSFERSTLNGYRFELLTEIYDRHFGEAICTYKVSQPDGAVATVKVIVPQYIMELVKAHADTETVPCQNRFWQVMSEEALANHLWTEAALPPDNVLKVEQLTPALARWVDGIMTIEAESSNAC
jgi:FixJ family two-component response regulator